MVGEDGSVTIEVAAELMNIEVRTIREWSAIGSLQIERRGDDEVVHLGQVRAWFDRPMGRTERGDARGERSACSSGKPGGCGKPRRAAGARPGTERGRRLILSRLRPARIDERLNACAVGLCGAKVMA